MACRIKFVLFYSLCYFVFLVFLFSCFLLSGRSQSRCCYLILYVNVPRKLQCILIGSAVFLYIPYYHDQSPATRYSPPTTLHPLPFVYVLPLTPITYHLTPTTVSCCLLFFCNYVFVLLLIYLNKLLSNNTNM